MAWFGKPTISIPVAWEAIVYPILAIFGLAAFLLWTSVSNAGDGPNTEQPQATSTADTQPDPSLNAELEAELDAIEPGWRELIRASDNEELLCEAANLEPANVFSSEASIRADQLEALCEP